MPFIDALNLLTLCVEHGILFTKDELIIVQHEHGTVLWKKDLLAQELMSDEEGQKALLEALSEKGVGFKPFDFGPIDRAIEHFAKT